MINFMLPSRDRHASALIFTLMFTVLACSCSQDPHSTEASELDNPASDNSMGSHLARAGNGDILMSWISHSDDIPRLQFARLSSSGWSQTVDIVSDSNILSNWADFPAVVDIGKDTLVAHWPENHRDSASAYNTRISISPDGGRRWQAPSVLHSDERAVEHGFASAFPAGDGFGVVWLDGRAYADSGNRNASAQLRMALFNSQGKRLTDKLRDPRVCDCCQTDIASDQGYSYLVYRDRTLTEERDIAFDVLAAGRWRGARKVLPDNWQIDACPVNGPAVAANGRAVAYAWFSAANNQRVIRLIRSLDRGESFTETSIGTAISPIGRVDIEILGNASIVISWLERVDDYAELRVQMFDLHGRTGSYKVISKLSADYRSGFPQMVRHAKQLVFSWTDVQGEKTKVRTATLPIAALTL